MDAEEVRSRLSVLRSRLAEMVSRDPDQEVTGIAVPVLDAVFSGSRGALKPDDEIAAVVRDLIDPDTVAAGGMPEVLASSALLVVDQLLLSLPPEPTPDLSFMTRSTGGSIFKPEDFGGPW